MLYRTPLRMLSDLVSPKALERILDSGARSRGKALADLTHADLTDLLKRDVFKRLQLSVPAQLAKKRVQEVLEALDTDSVKNTQIRNEDSLLAALEQSSKRFSLYFDWAEVQKLRALIGVARAEMDAGKSVPGLLDEGMGLVAALERRLNEGLVAQANDLAELKAELKRFTGVGGPKLRRLEGLIAQIDEAQTQDTLSPAEVERARHLSLELRKLVESSVISADPQQTIPTEMPDAALLTDEAKRRLRELDRESEARDLADLARDYDPVLRVRPDLASAFDAARARSAAGEVLGADLAALRDTFARERESVLGEQRERLARLEVRLGDLSGGSASEALGDARLALEVARGTLAGGALASDELARLESIVATLEASRTQVVQDDGRTDQLLALTRETYELETAARGVRGAESELAPRILEARAALERGELVSLDDLWALLERRMAVLAQEREDFDARADALIEEYDRYRHLAGETIQKLGRLAENLRRVRRLGQLSLEARAKYEQAVAHAETLLGEARAEFEAARELTSTFGADALSDLLGVFDTGGSGGGGLFGALGGDPPPPPPAEPLAGALDALARHGGARLALLRDGKTAWGQLDDMSTNTARDLVASGARVGAPRLITLEFESGGLLAMPLGTALLVARVDGESALRAWRDRLLEAHATLA